MQVDHGFRAVSERAPDPGQIVEVYRKGRRLGIGTFLPARTGSRENWLLERGRYGVRPGDAWKDAPIIRSA